jgi:hypothetical protein
MGVLSLLIVADKSVVHGQTRRRVYEASDLLHVTLTAVLPHGIWHTIIPSLPDISTSPLAFFDLILDEVG